MGVEEGVGICRGDVQGWEAGVIASGGVMESVGTGDQTNKRSTNRQEARDCLAELVDRASEGGWWRRSEAPPPCPPGALGNPQGGVAVVL